MAERFNRTALEGIRAFLDQTEFNKSFWAELLQTFCYIKNRWPTKTIPEKTPFGMWFKQKPGVSHLRRIGSVAYSHVPKDQRRKLDVNAERMFLIGYGTDVKGYRLYCPKDKKFHYSRDVVFDEKLSYKHFKCRDKSVPTDGDSEDITGCLILEDDNELRKSEEEEPLASNRENEYIGDEQQSEDNDEQFILMLNKNLTTIFGDAS